MADVGNCIHQIYCGIEQNIDNDAYYKNLFASYGLATYLTDYQGIRKAWDALVAAGEKVIKRYIYYPVSGMLCEISRGFE